MFRTLAGKILCLFLLLSILSLTSAVVLRFMLLSDFEEYRQGELLDRAQLVTAALEATYVRMDGWQAEVAARDALRALVQGLDIAVYDEKDHLITTSRQALEMLPPAARSRVEGTMASQRLGSPVFTMDFPLFSEGREIGTVEVSFLEREKELVYMARADRLLFISLGMTGLMAVLVSLGLARAITSPLHQLTTAARDIGQGKLGRRVAISGKDEIASLGRTFNLMSETLDRQEQLRKKLISNVAHELRTPVAAMRAELEAMIDGVIPTRRDALESLLQETSKLTSLIEGIEDMTRAEAGTLTLVPETLDLLPFLRNIADRFRPSFSEAGLELRLDCAREETLRADRDKLSRILANLLHNALKATAAGGLVTIEVRRKDDRTVIAVRDTGRGMDEETLANIFERFYSTRPDGLGLGLSIVRELVQAHGGLIEVQSKAGHGTTFSVYLPDLQNVS